MNTQKTYLVLIVLVLATAAYLIATNTKLPEISPSPTPTSSIQPDDPSNLIRLEVPTPNSLVKTPIMIKGEARGVWFFEASFPIKIYDADGTELGVVVAQADEDWMTENFVPFHATLEFKKPTTDNGVLVLQKDNPSGLPEHDAELRVPVKFDLANWGTGTVSSCRATGCSGQVCADQDIVTTCDYRPEYACYKTAKCERQEDGKCGWTPTNELVACLSAAFQSESN